MKNKNDDFDIIEYRINSDDSVLSLTLYILENTSLANKFLGKDEQLFFDKFTLMQLNINVLQGIACDINSIYCRLNYKKHFFFSLSMSLETFIDTIEETHDGKIIILKSNQYLLLFDSLSELIDYFYVYLHDIAMKEAGLYHRSISPDEDIEDVTINMPRTSIEACYEYLDKKKKYCMQKDIGLLYLLVHYKESEIFTGIEATSKFVEYYNNEFKP